MDIDSAGPSRRSQMESEVHRRIGGADGAQGLNGTGLNEGTEIARSGGQDRCPIGIEPFEAIGEGTRGGSAHGNGGAHRQGVGGVVAGGDLADLKPLVHAGGCGDLGRKCWGGLSGGGRRRCFAWCGLATGY